MNELIHLSYTILVLITNTLMDKLNTHYGSGTIRMASEGYQKHWAMKRENVSPNYTTAWEDILRVG